MDKKSVIVYTLIGLNAVKEIWDAVSPKPVLIGILDMLSIDATSNLVEFLSKYWLLIVSIIAFLILAIPPLWLKIRGLEMVIGKRFVDQVVVIDNKHFVKCTFDNCRIRYNGGVVILENTSRTPNSTFETENGYVSSTIQILKWYGALEKDFAKTWEIKPIEYFQNEGVRPIEQKQENPKVKTAKQPQKRSK